MSCGIGDRGRGGHFGYGGRLGYGVREFSDNKRTFVLISRVERYFGGRSFNAQKKNRKRSVE